MRSLMEHEWPGNVRELENTIERAVVLAQGGVITEDHVLYSSADQRHFVDIGARVRSGRPLGDIMGEVERQILTEALRQAQGDRLGASTLLSIDLGTFNEKLAYYGMPGELSVSAN
jgi:DNA-binding NtrC family response regulator